MKKRVSWEQQMATWPRCSVCRQGPALSECRRCGNGVCEQCRFYVLAGHPVVCFGCGTQREHSIRRLIEQLAGTPVVMGTVEQRNQIVEALSRYGVYSRREVWIDSHDGDAVVGLVMPAGSVRDRTWSSRRKLP